MGLQDVGFQLSASFSTTLIENCRRSESLETTTCPKNVVGGNKRHAPCKIPTLQQSLFLC